MSTSTKHTLVTTDQPEDNANSQEKTKPIVSAKDQLHYSDIRYRDEKIKELQRSIQELQGKYDTLNVKTIEQIWLEELKLLKDKL